MYNLIERYIYLLIFSIEILAMEQLSPCPEYFRYFWNDRNEIMGGVEIPSPPKYGKIRLELELSLAASLPSKYFGRIELFKSKDESARDIHQGRPLFYVVHFPLTSPLPVLTKLWLNGELYCTGPPTSGRYITTITLIYTLIPSRTLLTSAGNSDNNFDRGPNHNNFIPSFNLIEPSLIIQEPFQPSRPPPTIPPPTIPPPTIPPPPPPPLTIPSNIFNDNNYADCGLSNSINPLIAAGVKTIPGQWPWLVAIFVTTNGFKFQCSGTLITNKHIVTVAHCTRLGDLTLSPNTIIVSLGRFHLFDWREKGSINLEIKKYVTHPDYKGDRYDETADADLAVMTLRETVEFTKFIKPICLWTGSNDLRDIVGSKGYVVGWGKNKFGNFSSEPRLAVVPLVSQEDCLWSNAELINFTSNRTLCAGSRNGSGPCNGDSGSGLLIHRKDGRYYLRGAVSRSILDRNTMSCDLKNYIVYVDVTKYSDWIHSQISS